MHSLCLDERREHVVVGRLVALGVVKESHVLAQVGEVRLAEAAHVVALEVRVGAAKKEHHLGTLKGNSKCHLSAEIQMMWSLT